MTSVLNVLTWPWQRPARTPQPEDAAWTGLAEALRHTRYYPARQLRAPRDGAGLESVPPVPLDVYYREFVQFRNVRGVKSVPHPLACPWNPVPRVVAIQPWFYLDAAEVLTTLDFAALVRLRPECLAAPVPALAALGDAILAKRIAAPSLRYGVVAFTGIGQPLVTARVRDSVWRALGVPLFEQFRGFQGELLAQECDCHDGLHVIPDAAIFETEAAGSGQLLLTSLRNLRYPVLRLETGLAARLDREPCPCGRATPRLRDLRPASVQRSQAATAS